MATQLYGPNNVRRKTRKRVLTVIENGQGLAVRRGVFCANCRTNTPFKLMRLIPWFFAGCRSGYAVQELRFEPLKWKWWRVRRANYE